MTITIKNVPDEVHQELKAQAKEHGRSLNQEILMVLKGKEVVKPQGAGKRKGISQEELAAIRALRERIGIREHMTLEEMETVIEEGRA
ncbi:MAG: Arc family DNA-binding protein [Verrucomicrobiota bacterium]